jgi:hypothetical protein
VVRVAVDDALDGKQQLSTHRPLPVQLSEDLPCRREQPRRRRLVGWFTARRTHAPALDAIRVAPSFTVDPVRAVFRVHDSPQLPVRGDVASKDPGRPCLAVVDLGLTEEREQLPLLLFRHPPLDVGALRD